jgi:hypothetical protein
VLVAGGRSVGMSVGMSVGVLVGSGVFVIVGMSVFVGLIAAVLRPLNEGFVPQLTCALRQFVTSACKTAGSHALKKS